MKIIYVAKSVSSALVRCMRDFSSAFLCCLFQYSLFKVQLWLTSFEDYRHVLLANLPSNTARVYVLHKVLPEYLSRYILVDAVIYIAAIAIVTPSIGAVAIYDALRYRRSVDALVHFLLIFT